MSKANDVCELLRRGAPDHEIIALAKSTEPFSDEDASEEAGGLEHDGKENFLDYSPWGSGFPVRGPFSPLMLALHLEMSEEVTLAILEANPGEASADSRASHHPPTCGPPLMVALARRAPIGVIAALLSAHPDGARDADPAGLLALHVAAICRSPLAAVQAILALNPEAAKRGAMQMPFGGAAAAGGLLGAPAAPAAVAPLGAPMGHPGGHPGLAAVPWNPAGPAAAAGPTRDSFAVLLQCDPQHSGSLNNFAFGGAGMGGGMPAPHSVDSMVSSALSEALPLHLALAFGAPVEVVACLLDAHPPAVRVGRPARAEPAPFRARQ